jgi:hypothetical protein
MTSPHRAAGALLFAALLAGCLLAPSSSPTPLSSATPSDTAAPSVTTSATAAPTASPEPSFSLDLPQGIDARSVTVTVEPDLDGDGGEILVTVVNATDERIDELVLRWSTELDDVLFLAPFVPTEDRIRDGGPPLVQEWTKWVIGPGERGEPAGTISLGYGPLMPDATLAIPIHAERRSGDPIAFDLQLLAGNDLLQLAGGGVAELRVEVP